MFVRNVRVYILLSLAMMVLSTLTFAGIGDGTWLRKVPPKERIRRNPLATNSEVVTAGEKLFQHNCASCHGPDQQGMKDRPGLHSARVHEATPGELHWLLTNGSLKKGMPNWTRMPDQERWELVAFLKSLK
jgi:mono/diheme cytochrome c family protein